MGRKAVSATLPKIVLSRSWISYTTGRHLY